ncbi:MAG: HAMP domain-containing histidine kinase, partial [Candidatus Krumholzibacteriota bacterium]|nr:HAMP domain-containing histidine kinase [Candidatus Krumholzibacteriota bacterium]
ACYYSPGEDNTVRVQLKYGRVTLPDHPVIDQASALIYHFRSDQAPALLSSLPAGVQESPAVTMLAQTYDVAAPLFIRKRLIGIMFLGKRVSEETYTDFDLEVLNALSAASATTFNNAVLYKNARLSAREIEKLYQVRTEVIDRVSHEFRTPLTAIKGCVELIADGNMDTNIIGILSESTGRLEELISSLLELNSDEPDEEHDSGPYDPYMVLQRAISKFATRARDKELRFVLNADTDALSFQPLMNKHDMETVVAALLDNAVRFSAEGSTVEVLGRWSVHGPNEEHDGVVLPTWSENTKELLDSYFDIADSIELTASVRAFIDTNDATPSETEATGYLIVRIIDSGIGIPEDEIAMVSEPFRQASNSPNLGVRGRGLGLALVQKIVSNAGGFVCCRSSVGSGTTMSVYFPCE